MFNDDKFFFDYFPFEGFGFLSLSFLTFFFFVVDYASFFWLMNIFIFLSSTTFFSRSKCAFVGDLFLLIIADLLLFPRPYPDFGTDFNFFWVELNWFYDLPEGEDYDDLFLPDYVLSLFVIYFLIFSFFYIFWLECWFEGLTIWWTLALLLFFNFLALLFYMAFNVYF